MTTQRRCLLSADNALCKYRVYKLRSPAKYSVDWSARYGGYWQWRVAFQSILIAGGESFTEAITNAKHIIAKEKLAAQLTRITR